VDAIARADLSPGSTAGRGPDERRLFDALAGIQAHCLKVIESLPSSHRFRTEESLVPARENIFRQVGAIVYRTIKNEVRVLLVTSRDTGRWVIPKGHIDPGLTPAQAAAREAYEEAGIKGTIRASFPLGFFSYLKKLRSGKMQAAMVEVYVIRADKQLRKWPERGQRTMSWVPIMEAARLVDEPGLARLFRRFGRTKRAARLKKRQLPSA
jgi:uncharacterized protein